MRASRSVSVGIGVAMRSPIPVFLASTAVDVGLVTVQMGSLQSVRGPQVAAVTGLRTTVFTNAEAFNTAAGRQIVIDNTMIVVGSAGVQNLRDVILGD